MAEALAEEESRTDGGEEGRGEGDGGGLRHGHGRDAVEERDQAHDLDRGPGHVEGHAAGGEAGPPRPCQQGKQEEEAEQVAEEDQDEGPDLLGDDARQDGVGRDAGGRCHDQEGTVKHRRHGTSSWEPRDGALSFTLARPSGKPGQPWGEAMKIVEIREKAVPIRSAIRNAYIDFSQMNCSVVAVVTDVVRGGRPVVGYGFNSNGRYAQSCLLRERFIPRLMKADPPASSTGRTTTWIRSRSGTCS